MDWIDLLQTTTDRFADVLETGDLAAPVPDCPGWTLTELGEHTRWVHAWAANAVIAGNPDGATDPVGTDRATLVAGYRAAAGTLLDALRRTAPDEHVWTFGPEPMSAFWRRRQTQEVTIHLYDALASQGQEADWAISPELAWDGVDEVATLFYPRQVKLGRTQPLQGTVRFVATDLDRSLDLGDTEPGTELAAPAADLLLMLWNRKPVDGPAADVLATAAVTP